jgi:hypothetical protein
MDGDRLMITDVSSRILAHEIAYKYGLRVQFLNLGAPESKGVVVQVLKAYSDSIRQRGVLETISADKFNSMTVQDLEDMCEYWKMVVVFGHG